MEKFNNYHHQVQKHDKIIWYINEAYKNKWSRTILGNKIKMKSYELGLIEHHDNFIISNDNPLLDEIFNSKLAIGFIDKNKITTENLNHDYSEAYKILEEERKKSKEFLVKALNLKEG